MAMSATIALNKATMVINDVVNVALTLTNTASTAVTVTAINPFCLSTGDSNTGVRNDPALKFGVVNMGPNSNLTVNGNSGTLVLTYSLTAYASSSSPGIPAGSVNSATQNRSVNSTNTYDIGATCYTSDGSVFQPTVTTLTVNSTPLPCSN